MTAALVGDRPDRQRGTGANSFTPGRVPYYNGSALTSSWLSYNRNGFECHLENLRVGISQLFSMFHAGRALDYISLGFGAFDTKIGVHLWLFS